MREISLTQNKVALVDDEDYEWLNQWKWQAIRAKYTFYVSRSIEIDGKWHPSYMHREILKLSLNDKKFGDHKNRNGLDNRKENLRIVDRSLNNYNCKIHNHNTSGFRGVSWKKLENKWEVCIRVNGIKRHCGVFLDVMEAALKYDQMALQYRGGKAPLNFPERNIYEKSDQRIHCSKR